MTLAGCSPTSDDQKATTQPTSAETRTGSIDPSRPPVTAPSSATTTHSIADTTMVSATGTAASTVVVVVATVDASQPTAAATNLSSVARCDDDDPRRPLAELTWEPAAEPGRAQRLQVTIDPRGFDDNSLVGPEIPGDAASAQWTELSGQSLHRWRVLTERDGRWVASPPAQFEGPTCAIDYQPEP